MRAVTIFRHHLTLTVAVNQVNWMVLLSGLPRGLWSFLRLRKVVAERKASSCMRLEFII
jgi:hypothetical protein